MRSHYVICTMFSFSMMTVTITIIGASLSEPHIDGTTGRFHICIVVRPSPARHGWSHEVCRASVTERESALASVTARRCLFRLYFNATALHVQTISNIFVPQTTFQHEHTVQCGRRRWEEILRKSSWSVNVYCMRTGSCEVATYRTRKAAEILW